MAPTPSRRLAAVLSLALVLAQAGPPPAAAAPRQDDEPARQVTVFGVIADPRNPAVDPKLAKVAPQLRKLFPNHGFRLLGVKSKRLGSGQTLTCDLGNGFTAATTLIAPVDENGKVPLRCEVLQGRAVRLESLVTTPPNQLFFCDKPLDDGTRLLIGVGAR